MTRNSELLADVSARLTPFSLDYTAAILHQYMQLFCHSARLFLLLRFYPSKLIIQLYSLVHAHVKLRDKTNRQQELSDRNAMVQLICAADKPIAKLQQYFRFITPRIAQV